MSRLIVVSNRLPFSFRRTESGYELGASSGGLVTALSSYIERKTREDPSFECIWAGWPGATVEESDQAAVREQAMSDHGAFPIFLSDDEMSHFYFGFCNSTLWPLFHYFPSYVEYKQEHWETYQRVNRKFCDAVLEIVRPGDQVWVHDYQLLLLPKLLRDQVAGLSIGFFLHIPFPHFEIFRHLPNRWRRELLEGMLGADLVGFHTHDYVQYFLHAVFRTLGYEHHFGQITMGGEVRLAESFPIGIDFEKFMSAAASPEVEAKRRAIEEGLRDKQAIVSVDRLDYSKGLLHRLRGYEAFLEQYPEFRRKVVFILVVVPSREEVPQYQRMKHELDELVGQLNGAYGSVDWVPIIYQYRSIDFQELVALYSLAPVALITPLRDGMNLVAKEYLASKPDGSGVLVLSEMTGAARELGEAIQVNPNHRGEIAEALHDALSMDHDEQVHRNRAMQERLRSYDAATWVTSFLGALGRIKTRQGSLATHHLSGRLTEDVVRRYEAAKNRLILLDYDGTLVPFAALPHLAVPDPALMELLKELASRPRNRVFIISGRDRKTLDDWFRGVPVRIIAEHGAFIRETTDWQLIKPLHSEWKNRLRPLFDLYVDRVPGSLLEEKDFSLAWHYRRSDPELGEQRAKELMDDVMSYTANFDVQVLEGKKVVEVRNSGVNKGAAALHCVAAVQPDFVFAAGDDQTDEDMFRALPKDAVTVRVGSPHSNATYRVSTHSELRTVLGKFLELEE